METAGELNYRDLFERAPTLLMILRPDAPRFTILGASDAYLKATLKERSEIVGRPLFEVFPENPHHPQENAVALMKASLALVLKKKETDALPVARHDIPLPPGMGNGYVEKYWSVANSPVLSKSGEVIYILHRVEDVTELMRTSQSKQSEAEAASALILKQESVKRSEDLRLTNLMLESANEALLLSDTIIRNMAEGVCVVEKRSGQIVFTNYRFESLFGYALNELKDRPITTIGNGDEATNPLRLAERLVSPGLSPEGSFFEIQNFRKDGTPVACRVNASQFEHPDRGPVVVLVYEDISDRKEAERTIARQHAQMIAEARFADLGRLAGGVAHEINTPLSVIQLCAESLEESIERGQLDTPGALKTTEMIRNTVDRIAKIVKGLLSISRNAEKESPGSVPLRKILENTLSLCLEKFKHQSIDLKIGPIPHDLRVECRPTQISQVLLNLLGNACDAVENQPEKWISLDVLDLGTSIKLAVTDSGAGIPSDVKEKLFMPFYTSKEIGRGTGLGLSISRSIIDSHAGTLELDEESERTRFLISLPKRQTTTSGTA